MPWQLPERAAITSLAELKAQPLPGCGYPSTIQPWAAPIYCRSVGAIITQMEELQSAARFSAFTSQFSSSGKKNYDTERDGTCHSFILADRQNVSSIRISTRQNAVGPSAQRQPVKSVLHSLSPVVVYRVHRTGCRATERINVFRNGFWWISVCTVFFPPPGLIYTHNIHLCVEIISLTQEAISPLKSQEQFYRTRNHLLQFSRASEEYYTQVKMQTGELSNHLLFHR